MDFVGSAIRLTDDDIANAANEAGVEEAALRAVLDVETGGKGYDSSNRPKALFERHKFYHNLADDPDKQAEAVSAGLAYPKWGERPYPKTSDGVYDEVVRACAFDRDAALRSTSWGLGQIMGDNYKLVGYASVEDMVDAAMTSEYLQLKQMLSFLKNGGILEFLKNENWVEFARKYNGPSYAQNHYDEKLAQSYEKENG